MAEVSPGIALTAVLLTGGLSRRMGLDKATLSIDGEPLWVRQLALLRKLKPQAILISARSAPPWLPAGAELVLDAPPSRGPLSGIAAALARIQTTHLVALAVDLPGMTRDHLCKLTRLASPGWGVIPRNAQYWEPLAAIYPKQAAAPAQRALSSEDVSMQSFVGGLVNRQLLREYVLAAGERELYRNLNTPRELP